MDEEQRKADTKEIVQVLFYFITSILVIVALFLYDPFNLINTNKHSYLALLVFLCGVVGGFISIHQRLSSLPNSEISFLAKSKTSVVIIPLIGGAFSLVLLLMFMGNIIQGELFPTYKDEFIISSAETFFIWIDNAYPNKGSDVAKLLFWSFVAGFSERFVPRLIENIKVKKD